MRTPKRDQDRDKAEAEAQAAWDAAKPRSRRRDRHGREELLMHPFLFNGGADPRLVSEAPTKISRPTD